VRRRFVSIVSIVLALAFTASVAFAGTRWGKAVTFTTSGSSTAGAMTTSLSASSALVAAPLAKAEAADKGYSCAAPCTGLTLTATSTLVGLGSANADITMNVTGSPSVLCTNQGGNQAPGQNPPKVSLDGEQIISFQQISKNGNAPLDVTAELSQQTDGLPGLVWGCPNNNWAAQITSIKFLEATITVSQNSVVSLQQTFNLQ
jgi:hypothetical protein